MNDCTPESATSYRVSLIGFEQDLLAFLGQVRRVDECGKGAGLNSHIAKLGDHLVAPEHNVKALASGEPRKKGAR